MHCITFVLILSFDCTTFKKSLPLSESVFSVSGFYWLSHWLIDWLCIRWIKQVIDIRHVHRSANKNIENCSNCAFTMVLPKPPLRWILKLCNAGQIDETKCFCHFWNITQWIRSHFAESMALLQAGQGQLGEGWCPASSCEWRAVSCWMKSYKCLRSDSYHCLVNI